MKKEMRWKKTGLQNIHLIVLIGKSVKMSTKTKDIAQTEQKYVWMKSLSDTASGMLNGKAKIELETYVQMAYFDRILIRANRRMLTMSSGQYELKREEETGSRKEKAGLELCVIDHYNGTKRSVKTLSGGGVFPGIIVTCAWTVG